MKYTLEFYFDDFQMSQLFKNGIVIENAPLVPRYGDTIDFISEDYLTVADEIEQFSDYRSNQCLFAKPINTIFGKDTVRVQIMVQDEKSFKEGHDVPKFQHMLKDLIADEETLVRYR